MNPNSSYVIRCIREQDIIPLAIIRMDPILDDLRKSFKFMALSSLNEAYLKVVMPTMLLSYIYPVLQQIIHHKRSKLRGTTIKEELWPAAAQLRFLDQSL